MANRRRLSIYKYVTIMEDCIVQKVEPISIRIFIFPKFTHPNENIIL